MIISASRRTDIPAFYSDWFFNRIKEGFVLVRNPMNKTRISRIKLSGDVVDGIVFWTKNPIPMMDRLNEISKYNYYFQFTVTSYANDAEKNLPSKNNIIIPAFRKLSDTIGKERVVWRYDPIFLNKKYTPEYHFVYFEEMAKRLSGYTEKCTVSSLDMYRKIERNMNELDISLADDEIRYKIMERFSQIAEKYGIYIDTCAEKTDFTSLGIKRASCIDGERLCRIGGYELNIRKDKNQRKECGCMESIDIGAYNTCKNGCMYCYANYSEDSVKRNFLKHNPNSPLLFGETESDDVIEDRDMYSLKDGQISLF